MAKDVTVYARMTGEDLEALEAWFRDHNRALWNDRREPLKLSTFVRMVLLWGARTRPDLREAERA